MKTLKELVEQALNKIKGNSAFCVTPGCPNKAPILCETCHEKLTEAAKASPVEPEDLE